MFEIFIGGKKYTRFKSASLERSIDNSSGSFSFSTSSLTDYPIKRGDTIKVIIAGETKLTGFVNIVKEVGDSESRTVSVSGRDNICDIIDSTVPDAIKSAVGATTLKKLCEAVIDGLGVNISVIDNSGQDNIFTEDELETAESGTIAMEFLQNYSRKKQVFLIPSGKGDLIIYRPGDVKSSSPLIHKRNDKFSNNVKSYEVERRETGRFNKYTCVSQDNFGFDPSADYDEGVSRGDEVIDDEIRTGRIFEFVAEESMTDEECLERAKEESNIRRARSTSYSAVVAGGTQGDGTVWDIGQRVNVDDDFADVKGEFLIRSVKYLLDSSGGNTTGIVCAPIDAYTVQAVASKTDSRKSNTGLKFQRVEPEQGKGFKR